MHRRQTNNLNQYTAVGGTAHTCDDNGNLACDGLFRYYYDGENRLIDINDASDALVASYAYDYQGRRISRTIYGTPNETIRYAYDGHQIIAEYDGAGTLLRKFVYGPGIDEPICLIDAADANALYYYHRDGLGSVIALCDVNSAPVERYAYDVFGRPTIRDGSGTVIAESAFGNPYLFTGRAWDPETALYYYRARYYDYYTGRFLQPDPSGYADGLNLYTYVGNAPLTWVDPFGLSRYWRWGWTDIITFFPHACFDVGVHIGDRIMGTPEYVRKAKRMVEKPAEIGRQRREELEGILEGGPIPGTAGPQSQFNQWQKDVTDVSTSIPGISLTGPVPTGIDDIVTDLATGALVDAVEAQKECPPNDNE